MFSSEEDRLVRSMLRIEAMPLSSQEPGTSATLFLICGRNKTERNDGITLKQERNANDSLI